MQKGTGQGIAGVVSLKGIQHGVLQGSAGRVWTGRNQHARSRPQCSLSIRPSASRNRASARLIAVWADKVYTFSKTFCVFNNYAIMKYAKLFLNAPKRGGM